MNFAIFKGKLLLTLFLSIVALQKLSASQYVLLDETNMNPKAIEKISQIGAELHAKTNSNIYIYARESFGFPSTLSMEEKFKFIKNTENSIMSKQSGSYVIMMISLQDTYSNLLISKDLQSVINKDSILNDYVIPLLASHDKNSLNSKVSAAILNGYAEVADRIAKSKGVALESSIGSSGTQASTIWKVFMYTMVIGGLILYTVAVMRSKKK